MNFLPEGLGNDFLLLEVMDYIVEIPHMQRPPPVLYSTKIIPGDKNYKGANERSRNIIQK